MTIITAAQMRKIYALSRERGIDNDTLHQHVYGLVKKDSIKKLSKIEAIKVIDSLEGQLTSTPGMMTEKQWMYINGLLVKLGWVTAGGKPDMKRFMEFIKSQFSIESEKWITSSAAGKIIEAFKAMNNRAKQPV